MRAIAVLPAGDWSVSDCVGEVVLAPEHRHRRRIVLRTEAGGALLLDLPVARQLRDGDGLALERGGVVRVRSKPEPLLEIAAADGATLLRIAWHLGNRHLPVQVLPDRLRIRRDHVIAEMVCRLGGRIETVDAAFEPEAGAYSGHHPDGDPDG